MAKSRSRYAMIIEASFFNHFNQNTFHQSDRVNSAQVLEFNRNEIVSFARSLAIEIPKNLDDLVYSFRFRRKLPKSILAIQPQGFEWIIRGVGIGRYRFRLAKISRILPRKDLAVSNLFERRQGVDPDVA